MWTYLRIIWGRGWDKNLNCKMEGWSSCKGEWIIDTVLYCAVLYCTLLYLVSLSMMYSSVWRSLLRLSLNYTTTSCHLISWLIAHHTKEYHTTQHTTPHHTPHQTTPHQTKPYCKKQCCTVQVVQTVFIAFDDIRVGVTKRLIIQSTKETLWMRTFGLSGFSRDMTKTSPSAPPDARRCVDSLWGLNCRPWIAPGMEGSGRIKRNAIKR